MTNYLKFYNFKSYNDSFNPEKVLSKKLFLFFQKFSTLRQLLIRSHGFPLKFSGDIRDFPKCVQLPEAVTSSVVIRSG